MKIKLCWSFIVTLEPRQTVSISTQKKLTFADSSSILQKTDSPQPGPSRAPRSRAPSITPSIASQMTLRTMKNNPAFITGMNLLFWLIFVPLIGFSSQIIHFNLKNDDDLQNFKWQVFRKMIIETVLFRILSPLLFIFKNENFRSFAADTIQDWTNSK